MADWRNEISNKAYKILDAAKTTWDNGDRDGAIRQQGQLLGMAEYARLIGDRWTEMPCQTCADECLKHFDLNPK